MLRFVTGRKQAAIHKNIVIYETLKAAKERCRGGQPRIYGVTLTQFCFRVGLYKNTGVLLREQLMIETQRRKLEVKRT